MSDKIRVVVADDHTVVREGIRSVLNGATDVDVVAEAANGPEAFEAVRTHAPDVVVLDLKMPGESGIDVTKRLKQEMPSVRILILSMHEEGQYVAEAIRAGAHGYLLKDARPSELRDAVRLVSQGERYLSSRVASQLSVALNHEAEQEVRGNVLDQLTPRERQVLTLVAAGRTNKEIASELSISRRTVETHRESLMKKLEIRTVAGLTRFALEVGLLTQ